MTRNFAIHKPDHAAAMKLCGHPCTVVLSRQGKPVFLFPAAAEHDYTVYRARLDEVRQAAYALTSKREAQVNFVKLSSMLEQGGGQ